MGNQFRLEKLEELIVSDEKFLFTITSCAAIVAIFLNISVVHYPAIGTFASIVYFLINGVFLGRAFFDEEGPLFRLMFGNLFLVMLLGLVGWIVMIIYNLDVIEFTLVLSIVTAASSLINKKVKRENVAKSKRS